MQSSKINYLNGTAVIIPQVNINTTTRFTPNICDTANVEKAVATISYSLRRHKFKATTQVVDVFVFLPFIMNKRLPERSELLNQAQI